MFHYNDAFQGNMIVLNPFIYQKIFFVIGRSRGFYVFFVSSFKKVKFNIYIYLHTILKIKLLGLVNCSDEMVSFGIISPKTFLNFELSRFFDFNLFVITMIII